MSKNGARAYNASKNNTPKESTEPFTVEEVVKPVNESVEEIKEETAEPVDEAAEEIKEAPVDEYEVVKVSGCQKLRVRKTPTTEANNVIKIVPAGTILKVKKHNMDWSEIKDGGFVMSKFIVQV